MGEGEGDDSGEGVEGDEIGEEAKDEDEEDEEEGGAGSGVDSSVQCAWRVWLFGILAIVSFVTLSFFSLNHPENVNPVLFGIGSSP